MLLILTKLLLLTIYILYDITLILFIDWSNITYRVFNVHSANTVEYIMYLCIIIRGVENVNVGVSIELILWTVI